METYFDVIPRELSNIIVSYIGYYLDLDRLIKSIPTLINLDWSVINSHFPDERYIPNLRYEGYHKRLGIKSLMIKLSFYNLTIENMESLTSLDLSDRNLKDLPIEIGFLTNLRLLYLDHNQLTTIPKEIGF